MIDNQTAGLLAMAFFYLVVFAVGVYASRTPGTETSSEGLLLAGRDLPLFIGVFTMTATWVGGGYINGTAEAVYDPTRGLVWAQAPWGYALSLMLGGLVFARPMRRRGFTTLLDPFAQRYGARVAAILYVPALIGEIFWSAAILAALGTTFGVVLGLDFRTSIILSAAVAIAYTVAGGLWSVAYTDVVQLLCIVLGLGVAIPFALAKVGGAHTVWSDYEGRFHAAASFLPPVAAWSGGAGWGHHAWYWLDLALLLVCGGIPWQVYFQRVLSCRSERAAVGLSVVSGLGCLLLAVLPIVIGAIGNAANWGAAGAPAPPYAALVLPYVLHYLTPPLIGTIGLGAVAAAVMSSVDSSILSAASMFAWNIYRPLRGGVASERRIRSVMRAAVLVVGTLATWMALTVGSIYALWFLCADLVYVVLFPQLVMALFSKRANRQGALAGAAVGFFLRIGGGEPLLGLPAFIPYPFPDPVAGSLFPFRTCAMLASLATIWLVSNLTARGTQAGSSGSLSLRK